MASAVQCSFSYHASSIQILVRRHHSLVTFSSKDDAGIDGNAWPLTACMLLRETLWEISDQPALGWR